MFITAASIMQVEYGWEATLLRTAAVVVAISTIGYFLLRFHQKVVMPTLEWITSMRDRWEDITEHEETLTTQALTLERIEAKTDRTSELQANLALQVAAIREKQEQTAQVQADVVEQLRPTNGDRSSISDRVDKAKKAALQVRTELDEHRRAEQDERTKRIAEADKRFEKLEDGQHDLADRLHSSVKMLRGTLLASVEGTPYPPPLPDPDPAP